MRHILFHLKEKHIVNIMPVIDEALAKAEVKLDDILGKEIIVTGFNVNKSKYHNNSGNCLKLQFEHDGTKHVLFTGSNVLINQIERYQSEIPFISTIIKVDKFYTFS